MKKLILLFSFIFFSSICFSQVYFEENFDYPFGDTNTIASYNWTVFSSTLNPIKISTPGLVYGGYPLSNIGNAVKLDTTGQDAYRNFISNSNIDSIKNMGGAAYISALITVSTAKPYGAYVLAMLDSGSTSNFRARLYVKDSLGNVRFGITKSAAADTVSPPNPYIWSTNNYAYNTTYLVVMKYAFIPGSTNDLVSLYVFDAGVPDTEPTPTFGPLSFGSSDAGRIGRVLLRQGENSRGPRVNIDGIRVTTSWMPSVWNIKLAIQGLYDPGSGMLNKRDTVNIYLQDVANRGLIVDSASAVIDSVTLTGTYTFTNATNGSYYLLVKYRNMPEFRNGLNTWSKAGGEALTRLNGSYDFTTSASQAFGNNMILKGSIFTIYNGDVSQEGTIDLTDLIATQNASTSFVTGYINTDMDGDNAATLSDVLIVYNNSSNFVQQVAP